MTLVNVSRYSPANRSSLQIMKPLLHRWQTDPSYVDEQRVRVRLWTLDGWHRGSGPSWLRRTLIGKLAHGYHTRWLRCLDCAQSRQQWQRGNPPMQAKP